MLTLSTSTTITRAFIPCDIQSQTHYVNKNKGAELKPLSFCSKYVNKAAKWAHVWINSTVKLNKLNSWILTCPSPSSLTITTICYHQAISAFLVVSKNAVILFSWYLLWSSRNFDGGSQSSRSRYIEALKEGSWMKLNKSSCSCSTLQKAPEMFGGWRHFTRLYTGMMSAPPWAKHMALRMNAR